jgi:hypothetical protein
MKTLCPATYAVKDTENGGIKVVPFYCKQWACERCRSSVSKLWAHRIYEAFAQLQAERAKKGSYQVLWFVTFTMPSGWQKTNTVGKAHYDYLKKCLSVVIRECRKKYADYAYVAVFEAHKTGVPHLHMIASRPLPTPNQPEASKHEVHDYAYHHGFGFMCDQQTVNSRKAASYVAKYLTKSGHKMPKGTRRVLATHELIPEAEKSGGAWIARQRGQDWYVWAANVESRTPLDAIDALEEVDDMMAHNPDGIQRKGINSLT